MLRRIERLFCHYRATGDARALGIVFDRTAGELLRVALHLTRDRHRAEDLLQSTFLTAMEKARQYDQGQRLLPWLLTILANHARQLHRKEQRALPAVAEATGRDVAEQAAARELVQVCERAVDALPEPYRHVLILHLRHGMSGLEIAHALDRPDSTVRNQIARGLDLLRRKLPAGIASAATLITGGRGLAAVRAEILARCPVHAGATAGAASLSLGVLLMSKKIALPLALVALAAGGTWYSGLVAGASSPSLPPGAASQTADGGKAARDVDAHESAAASARREASSRSLVGGESATGSLLAEVVVRDDGSPAAALPFTVWTMTEHGQRIAAEGNTQADGSASVAGLLPGGCTFELAVRKEQHHCEITPGLVARVRIEIERGWQLDGVVVDASGRPVAEADVRCQDELHSVLLARSAADGRFHAAHLQGQVDIWAIAAGRQPSRRQAVPSSSVGASASTGSAPVRLVIGEPGNRLAGRVVDEQGAPVPGALVFVGIDTHAGSPFIQWLLHDTRTGDDGTFVCDWLPPGNLFVGALPPDNDGARATAQRLAIDAGVPAHVLLELGDGARVRGQARDAEGRPLSGVTVSARVRDDSGLGPFDFRGVTTHDDGCFELAGLLAGSCSLCAQLGQMQSETTVPLQRRQEFAWHPELAPGGTIAVRLLDPEGQPLSGYMIELRRPDDRGHMGAAAWQHTDAEGRCRFEHLMPIQYSLRVLVEGYSVCLAEQQAGPGSEVVFRLDASHMPSARLSGRVVDARGAPIRDGDVFFHANADSGQTLRLDRAGHFATGLVPPGAYSLAARAADAARGTAGGLFTVAANEQRDIGDLVLKDTASIAVRLRSADGAKIQGAVLRLGSPRDVDPGAEDLQPDEVDGVYRRVGIDPESYVLRFFAADAAPQSFPLQLAAGERRELDLVVRRGVAVVLELQCTDATHNGILNGLLTITDAAGERLLFHRLWGYFDDYWQRSKRIALALPPGTYRVHAAEYGGRTRDLDLVVPAAGMPEPFAVDLR